MNVFRKLVPATRKPGAPARRNARSSQKGSDAREGSDPNPSARSYPPRLLTSQEVPPWYRADYIATGYRPVTNSVWLCLESLAYLHNETANIYSHLIPAVIALEGNRLLASYFASRFPLALMADRLVFHFFLTTSALCFGVSSAFHTMLCHSPSSFALWIRLDYVAISFQILGSFVSGIYVSFYCESLLQKSYWSMVLGISILCLLTVIAHLHPRLQSKEWRVTRLAVFVATGLSAFVPIFHAIALFPYDQLEKQAGLRYYYLEGVFILTGVGFYASHFPESWKPAAFDIWGSSHQIFHLLVALAAAVHLYGITSAFEWNYVNKRCSLP